jgi:hypothetical protein
VLDGFDDVASAGFALCANHGCAFGNATEGFAEVAAAADEGSFEVVLCDMVKVVGRSEDFGFIDIVDADGFEDLSRSISIGGEGEESERSQTTNLAFNKVSNTGLGHDGDCHGLHDLLNH